MEFKIKSNNNKKTLVFKILTFNLKPLIFFILTFNLLPLTFLHSAFLDAGVGARPLGMGNAFVAVADDGNTLIYNSAGLSQIEYPELTGMYAKLYPGIDGLNYGYLSYIYPNSDKYGNFGFGWLNFTAKDLYEENTLILSYGYPLSNINFIGELVADRFFSGGFNIKLLEKKYQTNEWTAINSVFADKTAARGFTVDLGLLYEICENFKTGLSLENITQPDISLQSESKVLRNYRFGASYVLTKYEILSSVETTWRNKEYKVQAGLEKWFFEKTVAPRIGFGVGSSKYLNLTAGAGFNFKMKEWSGQVDYAYLFPLNFISGNGGIHYISLTARMGSLKEKKGGDRENTYFNQGIKYYKDGKLEDAIEQWEEVLNINSKHKKAGKYIKQAKMDIQKEKEKELKHKLKLIKKHYNKAFKSYSQKRFKEAREECEKVLSLEPEHEKAKILLENAEEKMEQE